MKYFITRNKQWLEFIWIVGVLVFFKLYNDFIFEQGDSYIFFIALFIVPFSLELESYYVRRKNKAKYHIKHSSFLKLIESNLDKELLDEITKTTRMLTDPDSLTIYFGPRLLGTIKFSETFASVSIVDTSVEYRFFYSQTEYILTKYDESGFEFRPVTYLFQRMLNRINQLTSLDLVYKEYYKKKKIVAVALMDKDDILYFNKVKHNVKTNDKQIVETYINE